MILIIFKVNAIIGKNDEAILDFEKVPFHRYSYVGIVFDINYKYGECLILQVRSVDPYVVTYMDEYAMLLKLKSDNSKLNKLVHDLLDIDHTRPEVFVALSVLWEKKDERAALSYAEKVNSLLSLCLFS